MNGLPLFGRSSTDSRFTRLASSLPSHHSVYICSYAHNTTSQLILEERSQHCHEWTHPLSLTDFSLLLEEVLFFFIMRVFLQKTFYLIFLNIEKRCALFCVLSAVNYKNNKKSKSVRNCLMVSVLFCFQLVYNYWSWQSIRCGWSRTPQILNK